MIPLLDFDRHWLMKFLGSCRGASLLVPCVQLRQEVRKIRRAVPTPSSPHRRQEVRLRHLWPPLRQVGPLDETRGQTRQANAEERRRSSGTRPWHRCHLRHRRDHFGFHRAQLGRHHRQLRSSWLIAVLGEKDDDSEEEQEITLTEICRTSHVQNETQKKNLFRSLYRW